MSNPESDSNSNTLLCSENSNLTSDDQKNDDQNLDSISYGGSSSGSTFIRFFPLFQQTEDIGLRLMYHKEKEQLPRDDYLLSLRTGKLDLTIRKDALDWMFKAYLHFGFGALTVCLAINYVDRFLSVYELPRGKTWTVQLLAVACLSLAVKMEEMHVPLSVYLQEVGDPKFIFEGKTIKRMELLVLNTLKWRMQAYTPCSFIENFLTKVNNDEMPSKSLVNRAVQIILSTVKGIDFLEFRPSEIAAAVAMCASGERQAIDIDKALSSSIHVEKAKVFKCIELIKDLALMRNKGNAASASASSTNMPQSPAGVLEAACFSYKSDEKTVGSSQNSSHTTAPADNKKRRKLEGPSQGGLNY